jgi:DHA2 family multidrug resistance protein
MQSLQSRALLATVVMANILQGLDLTITNIALATIAGQMSATLGEATWLLTAYVVGAALGLPLTGFLNDRLGRRTLFVGTVAGFTVTSFICGVATTLPALVLARFLQGVFSAPIAPICNAVLAASYPAGQLPRVMSYFNMSMLVVPILGPAFGGFVTELYGWRWLFLINVPIGVLIVLSALRFMEETPREARLMDWTGFVVLAATLVSFQLIIDHGNDNGFDSPFIVACGFTLAAALAMLIVHYVSRPAAPILGLAALRDRNYAIALLACIPFSIALWGGQVLQPFLFQQQYGHSPVDAGLLLMPRALGAFCTMFLYSRIAHRFSPATFLLIGGSLASIGCLWMTQMSPDMTGQWMIAPLALQGLGLGLVITPIVVMAFISLPKELAAEASTLYFLVRTVASAAAIGVMSVYTTRGFDRYWGEMRGLIDTMSPAASRYLAPLGLTPDTADGAAVLAGALARQSTMAAFIDSHWLAAAATIALLPLAFLLRLSAPRPVAVH